MSEVAVVSLAATETATTLYNVISPTHVSHLQSVMGLGTKFFLLIPYHISEFCGFKNI